VGQLIPLKGVDVLLRAFKRVLAHWDVKLDLVYQTADLESRYRKLVDDYGIADRVHFAGFLSAPELAERYRRAHLLVLPSYAECLPSVVTEALLSGLPVVASAVGGVTDQIGGFGMTVEAGNVDRLSDAIQGVLSRHEEFRSMRGQMRAYAIGRFSVDQMVTEHVALYERVVENARNTYGIRSRCGLLDRLVQIGMELFR
jgi:glycosyltransferase involved in cell wall biosynthesis